MDAFVWLSQSIELVPAFESAHDIVYLKEVIETIKGKMLIVSLFRRGDKDMMQAMKLLKL